MEPIKETITNEEDSPEEVVRELLTQVTDTLESSDPEDIVDALLEHAEQVNAPNLQQLAEYLNIDGDSDLYAQLQEKFPDLVSNLSENAGEVKEVLQAFLSTTSPEEGFALLVDKVPQLALTLDPIWLDALSSAISEALHVPIPPELWTYLGEGTVGDAVDRLITFYEPVIRDYLLGVLGDGVVAAGNAYLERYLPQAAREAGTATYEAGLSALLTLLYYAAPEETAKLVSSVANTLNAGYFAGETINSVLMGPLAFVQALGALAAGSSSDQSLGLDVLNALTTSFGGTGGAYFELPNGEKYFLTNIANQYVLAMPHTSYLSFDLSKTNKPGNDVILLRLDGRGSDIGSVGRKAAKELSKSGSSYFKAAGSAAKAYNQFSSGMGSMSVFYDVAYPALLQALEWERQKPDNLRDLIAQLVTPSQSQSQATAPQLPPGVDKPIAGGIDTFPIPPSPLIEFSRIPNNEYNSSTQQSVIGRDPEAPEGSDSDVPVSPLGPTDPGLLPGVSPLEGGQQGSSYVDRVSGGSGVPALVEIAEHEGTKWRSGRFGAPVPR